MKILVATASRHGATREIGEKLGADIAAGLRDRGVDARVDICDAEQVDDVAGYDAAIVGSAVYMGRWLKSARKLVDRELEQFQSVPVWLFSSGPVVAEDTPSPDTGSATAPWARDHHTFGGKLDRSSLSRSERLVASAVHATDRDNRSAEEITEWAQTICESLAATVAR